MQKDSTSAFSKISMQMDKLNQLFNKQKHYREQIKGLIYKQSSSESSLSDLQNIDNYFKQYNNPTTKSLPIEGDPNHSSQIQQGDSQSFNTIYRNLKKDQSFDEDRDNLHDDKSTVILAGTICPQKKKKNINNQVSQGQYSSLNVKTGGKKREVIFSKGKKTMSKTNMNSLPSQCQNEQSDVQIIFQKNGSISKEGQRMESPLLNGKMKKVNLEQEYQSNNLYKDLKAKLSKISKIDREQLNRLQQKKSSKKTQLSSNRKKVKITLASAKSTMNINYNKNQKYSSNNLSKPYTSIKSISKGYESMKKQTNKNDDKLMTNHQDWQRIQKNNKKLNRVNICRLQENIKKTHQKRHTKQQSSTKIQKKIQKKQDKYQSPDLKLHFTEMDQQFGMKKLIEQKQLNKQYQKQTQKYKQSASKLNKQYFRILMKQCRQTSEQAVLKIKLITIILYFFDQFSNNSLISQNINPKSDSFFSKVAQQDIIQVLLHPKRVICIIESLPSILMNDNTISAQRIKIFKSKFAQINDQLEQQLSFFLIKKNNIYKFVHSLSQYLDFLEKKQLIAQTKRNKLQPQENVQAMYGFYSSRSKRDDSSKKYIKKNEGPYKKGFRCDSDRKIALEDQDLYLKQTVKQMKHEKSGNLKRLHK